MNIIKKLAMCLVVALSIISITSTVAFAAENDDDVIRVTGMGVAPDNAPNASFAKTYARQAAKLDALRQIAEIIYCVADSLKTIEEEEKKDKISIKKEKDETTYGYYRYRETTFEEGHMIKDIFESGVEIPFDSPITKYAKVIAQKEFKYNNRINYEVTMEMPLNVLPADILKKLK